MARTALVTGGTRGLGGAISLALRDAGYRVAAVYHKDGQAAQALAGQHGVAVYQWDVADWQACVDGVAAVERDLGPVEVLVNNAGVTRDAALHKMTPEQWNTVLLTNLGSLFNMSRQVINGMRERGFGRIVNISSVNGERGQAGQCNYSAAKAGVLGFTRALALENARKNITVNAVAPGYCDTAMVAAVPADVLQTIVAGIPAGRLGTPDDIARVVAFLVADGSAYITGATIDANGGLYMG